MQNITPEVGVVPQMPRFGWVVWLPRGFAVYRGEKNPQKIHFLHPWAGPAQWHQSYEDCKGNRQSPVNIVTRDVVYEKSLKPLSFEGYNAKGSAQWDLQNNGHTGKYCQPAPGGHLGIGTDGIPPLCCRAEAPRTFLASVFSWEVCGNDEVFAVVDAVCMFEYLSWNFWAGISVQEI